MMELTELIERVEALSGPDREASRDIWMYFGTPEWKRAYIEAQAPCGCPHEQAVEYSVRHLPDITASIDAALSFAERVMPGWTWCVGTDGSDDFFANVWNGVEEANAYAPTPPLAIILATLRAKAEELK